jgi:hypothetical protein
MCRFSYFVYRGKYPVTIHSENKRLYCCVVEISKKELNGSDRNGAQLQNAARNLIRYSLRGSYVYGENLIDSLLRCEPTEIAEDEFKLLKKTRLDLPSSMPGGLYRVKQWPNSSIPSSAAFALPAA